MVRLPHIHLCHKLCYNSSQAFHTGCSHWSWKPKDVHSELTEGHHIRPRIPAQKGITHRQYSVADLGFLQEGFLSSYVDAWMQLKYCHHTYFWIKTCPISYKRLAKGDFLCTPESPQTRHWHYTLLGAEGRGQQPLHQLVVTPNTLAV